MLQSLRRSCPVNQNKGLLRGNEEFKVTVWNSGPFGFGVIQNAASNVPRWCHQQDSLNWATTEHFKLVPSLPSLHGLLLCHPWNYTECQGWTAKDIFGKVLETPVTLLRVLHFKVFYFLLGFNVLILMFWSHGLRWLCRVEHQTHFYWQQGCAWERSGTAADNKKVLKGCMNGCILPLLSCQSKPTLLFKNRLLHPQRWNSPVNLKCL